MSEPQIVPFPPRTSRTAWHYTDGGGLLGILDSERLWASAPNVLNDAGEFEYGMRVVQDLWSVMRSGAASDRSSASVDFIDQVLAPDWIASLPSVAFIVSASSQGDVLSQWRSYSGGDGFAIAFDLEDSKWMAAPDLYTQESAAQYFAVAPTWHDVIYDEDRQKEVVNDVLTFLATNAPRPVDEWDLARFRLAISPLPFILKHPAFVDEREVRWVGAAATAAVRYRSASGRLLAYTPVGAWDANPSDPSKPLPVALPITGVCCGPTSRLESTTVVKRLLESKQRGDVPVTKSEIPYIGS